jgi:aminoglycoside 3-N-acetyltransferase
MKKLYFILKRFLPSSLLRSLRSLYFKVKLLRIKALSEDDFKKILVDNLGIQKGTDVFVHSSLQLMKIDFPFYRIIPILREILGNESTILFPATHFSGRAAEYMQNENVIFDVKRDSSIYGLVSEMALRAKGAKRSWHPTNSVVAIGPKAEEYVCEHHKDIYPCGKRSPYYKLIENNAILLGIGVSTEYFSFVHCVEDAKEFPFPIETREQGLYKTRVKTPENTIIEVETLVAHSCIKYRNIPKYIKTHIESSIAKDLCFHGIPFYRAKARELYEAMGELAKQGITIYTKNNH